MRALAGSLCVFAAGGIVWQRRRKERQRQRALLAELAGALERMEAAIRLDQTPLPRLLAILAEEAAGETGAFFRMAAWRAETGEPPSAAWAWAAESLPLSEGDKRALIQAGRRLQGEECSVCKGLLLASEQLRSSLEQLERQRPEEDRRNTALCFSAAAMLVILLI